MPSDGSIDSSNDVSKSRSLLCYGLAFGSPVFAFSLTYCVVHVYASGHLPWFQKFWPVLFFGNGIVAMVGSVVGALLIPRIGMALRMGISVAYAFAAVIAYGFPATVLAALAGFLG